MNYKYENDADRDMTAPELVKEFYPDAYVVPTKGGFIVRGTWNGIRFNRLHAEPEATPEAAWDAVIERMNSEATQLTTQSDPVAPPEDTIASPTRPKPPNPVSVGRRSSPVAWPIMATAQYVDSVEAYFNSQDATIASLQKHNRTLGKTLELLTDDIAKTGETISALQGENQELRQVVKDRDQEARRLMWITHGHMGIYGDDGEMQCSQCAVYGCWDYKNSPWSEVVTAYNAAILER